MLGRIQNYAITFSRLCSGHVSSFRIVVTIVSRCRDVLERTRWRVERWRSVTKLDRDYVRTISRSATPIRARLLTLPERDDYKYVVMPMRIEVLLGLRMWFDLVASGLACRSIRVASALRDGRQPTQFCQ